MLAAAASEEVPTSNGVNDQVKGLVLILLSKVLLLVVEHLVSTQLLHSTMPHTATATPKAPLCYQHACHMHVS